MQDLPEPGAHTDLHQLCRQHRLLLIFAPYRENSHIQWQQQALAASHGELQKHRIRLCVAIGQEEGYLDAEPISRHLIVALREQLEIEPGLFTLVLLDQGGRELLWQTRPIKPRDLFTRLDISPHEQDQAG